MIYGNPSYESIQSVKQSILLRELLTRGALTPLLNVPYPSESDTIKELTQMVTMAQEVDSTRLAYCIRVDNDLYGVMSEFLESYGVRVSPDELAQELDRYDPIIDFLKLKYNRPRPFQAAGVHKIPLYPLVKTDANTSAYPSGHTFCALMFYGIYRRRYPELLRPLGKFVWDIKRTREEGGVHYPSDGMFALKVYQQLKPFLLP